MTGGAKDEPYTQIKRFGTIVSELERLAALLIAEGCTRAVMESTGSYWKPAFNLRDARSMMPLFVKEANADPFSELEHVAANRCFPACSMVYSVSLTRSPKHDSTYSNFCTSGAPNIARTI
jgi:hypothetical protein